MVSGSLPLLPPELLAQLKVGGRMFVISGDAPVMNAQLVTRTAEEIYQSTNLFETLAPALVNATQPERFTF